MMPVSFYPSLVLEPWNLYLLSKPPFISDMG
jgi:hypothetical protein